VNPRLPAGLTNFGRDFLKKRLLLFFLLDQKEPKNQGLSPSTTHYGRLPLHKINSPYFLYTTHF
jgi:hypothetical protein